VTLFLPLKKGIENSAKHWKGVRMLTSRKHVSVLWEKHGFIQSERVLYRSYFIIIIIKYLRYNECSDWSNSCYSVYIRRQRFSVCAFIFHYFKTFYKRNVKQMCVCLVYCDINIKTLEVVVLLNLSLACVLHATPICLFISQYIHW
jgi:hypothetical protein